jgi:hypothetical protein
MKGISSPRRFAVVDADQNSAGYGIQISQTTL